MTPRKASDPQVEGAAAEQHLQTNDSAGGKRPPPPPPPPPPFAILPTAVFADRALLETDLRVLGALCSFFNRKTYQCNPRHNWIALRAGVSRSCVRASLNRLQALGYVDWYPDFRSDGGRSVNHYVIPDFGTAFDHYGEPASIPDTDLPLVSDADHPLATDADQGVATHADHALVVVRDQHEQIKEQIMEQTSSTPRIAPKRDVARDVNNSNSKKTTQLLSEEQKRKGPAFDAS